MDSDDNTTKARSRSRSRCGSDSKPTSSRRSSHKKSTKNALPPDVPPQCRHLPPPPYRPAGPFALFFAANFSEVEVSQREHAMELLAYKWGCMSHAQKMPYYQKAIEVKEEYRNKRAEFFSKREELGIKTPVSGYAMFIADFAGKNRGSYACATQLICEGAKEWRKLPLQEKDVWNKQSLEYSESYAENMWSVCKKKVQPRYGKYDARIKTIKPPDFQPAGHQNIAEDQQNIAEEQQDIAEEQEC